MRCPRCRSVLALSDIVSRETPLSPAVTFSAPMRVRRVHAKVHAARPIDEHATLKDIEVVFADGTRPSTDDVAPASGVGVTIADVLPPGVGGPAVPRKPLVLERLAIPRSRFAARIVDALKTGPLRVARTQVPSAVIRTATKIGDAFSSLDRAIGKRRTSVLLGGAVLSIAAMALDRFDIVPALGGVVGLLFLILTSVLALARIASIREDDGTLTFGALFDAARARRARDRDRRSRLLSCAVDREDVVRRKGGVRMGARAPPHARRRERRRRRAAPRRRVRRVPRGGLVHRRGRARSHGRRRALRSPCGTSPVSAFERRSRRCARPDLPRAFVRPDAERSDRRGFALRRARERSRHGDRRLPSVCCADGAILCKGARRASPAHGRGPLESRSPKTSPIIRLATFGVDRRRFDPRRRSETRASRSGSRRPRRAKGEKRVARQVGARCVRRGAAGHGRRAEGAEDEPKKAEPIEKQIGRALDALLGDAPRTVGVWLDG